MTESAIMIIEVNPRKEFVMTKNDKPENQPNQPKQPRRAETLEAILITNLVSLHLGAHVLEIGCDGVIHFGTKVDTLLFSIDYPHTRVVVLPRICEIHATAKVLREHEKCLFLLEGICTRMDFEFVILDKDGLAPGQAEAQAQQAQQESDQKNNSVPPKKGSLH